LIGGLIGGSTNGLIGDSNGTLQVPLLFDTPYAAGVVLDQNRAARFRHDLDGPWQPVNVTITHHHERLERVRVAGSIDPHRRNAHRLHGDASADPVVHGDRHPAGVRRGDRGVLTGRASDHRRQQHDHC
jgi:hypothetical protein